MRILHCCLASFYIDNYSYQENILPREHKKLGYNVEILASTETFVDNNSLGYITPSSYLTEDNIPITRLQYKKILPLFIMKKLRIYDGVDKFLYRFKPEIIFIHDMQFLDIKHFVKYAKKFPNTKIYVDCHTDFYNSARTWISKNILHRIIYRYCARLIEPYTIKFWGVLPARVDFLLKMYKLPHNKVDLLVMGAEDDLVKEARDLKIRQNIRKAYGISEDDFLIITGGKIDHHKTQTLLLMKAVKNIRLDKVKLLIFGSVSNEFKNEFMDLIDDSIKYIGWINSKEIYKYFYASDLVVFPGLHSVLWEQAVGLGMPCVFKYIKGFNHIDLNGNCLYIYNGTVDEIKQVLTTVINNKDLYMSMKRIAEEKGIKTFSYQRIAKKSIEYRMER